MIHQISNSIGNYNYNIFIYEKTIYKASEISTEFSKNER